MVQLEMQVSLTQLQEPPPKAWRSLHDKGTLWNGPAYDSVSDSTVIKLSASSPSVSRLLLPDCVFDSTAVAV